MKRKNFVVAFLIIVILLGCFLPLVCFAESSELTFDEIASNEISNIFQRMELKSIEESKGTAGFSCFAVNENGDYALGYDIGSNDIIQVYNAENSYLYGFSCIDNGAFELSWHDDGLIIYRVRSDLAVWIDEEGNCLGMKIVQNTTENDEYMRKVICANKKVVNGVTYLAEHWLYNHESLYWGQYSRLVKIEDEERSILFDVSELYTKRFVATAAVVITVYIMICILLVAKVKHRRTKSMPG